MKIKSKIILSALIAALVISNVYQYGQNQLQAEQTGAYIQMTTLDAMYSSSRNCVWDYYGDHPQLLQVVYEDIQTVSACHAFMYRGNDLFSNLRRYVLRTKNRLDRLEAVLEEGHIEEIAIHQALVADSMKGVRDALDKTDVEIDALDLDTEGLDRAWYDAYWEESGPVYDILSKNFPAIEFERP